MTPNFTPEHLDAIRRHLPPNAYVLDPFTGDGTIHQLRRYGHGLATIGVSIEPEHAANPYTLQANPATDLVSLFGADRFDAVITAPPLGLGAESFRREYGFRPSPSNPAAHKFFSDAYRATIIEGYRQAVGVLKPGGVFIVALRPYRLEDTYNIKPHFFHLPVLVDLGLVDTGDVIKPSRNLGGYRRSRMLHVLRKPSTISAPPLGRVECCRESCAVRP